MQAADAGIPWLNKSRTLFTVEQTKGYSRDVEWNNRDLKLENVERTWNKEPEVLPHDVSFKTGAYTISRDRSRNLRFTTDKSIYI